MTREQILLNSIWIEGKIKLFSPFFQQEVIVNLCPSEYRLKDTHEIISAKMVQQVNDFLNLSDDQKGLMQKLLWQHCQMCCEAISYGFDPRSGETETQANLREFGVQDEASAYEKANLDHVSITEDRLRTNRFVVLRFYPPWEDEHGCELILKNGVLLDFFGEGGTYLGQFDA
ncbi:MAG: hypothetical protein AAF206_04790 [Bacteroidota bacterium]